MDSEGQLVKYHISDNDWKEKVKTETFWSIWQENMGIKSIALIFHDEM